MKKAKRQKQNKHWNKFGVKQFFKLKKMLVKKLGEKNIFFFVEKVLCYENFGSKNFFAQKKCLGQINFLG